MKKYLYSLILFVFCIVSSSCNNNNINKESTGKTQGQKEKLKADSSIILNIGDEKLTVYELQKNYRLFKQNITAQYHRLPGKAEIDLWINEFNNRAYILADAHTKGYYNKKDIQAIVENTASLMLTQPNGLLEHWLTAGLKPANIAEEKKYLKNNDNGQNAAIDLRQKMINNYYGKIDRLTFLQIDKTMLVFLDGVIKKHNNIHEITKDDFGAVFNNKLATYNAPDAKKVTISMADFMMYYNSLPFKKLLSDTAIVREYLQTMASNTYIRKDAENIGITNDAEFKLDKKNFTDNVVYQKYREEQLSGSSPVSENEILKAYSEVKNKMLRPTGIVYSIFTFSNLKNASDARWLLQNKPNDDKLRINALSESRHVKLDERSGQLTDTLKKELYRLQPGKISIPIATNDHYTILLSESATGSVPLQLNEIRPYLVKLVLEKRRTDNLNKRMSEWKAKYPKQGEINVKLLSDI